MTTTTVYLEYIRDERGDEHAVEFQRLIAEYIEQTTTTAVFRQHTHGARVDARSDERVEIIVTNFSNLRRQSYSNHKNDNNCLTQVCSMLSRGMLLTHGHAGSSY